MPNESGELVNSNVLKGTLSPEDRATVDQMVIEVSPRIEFVKNLLESMRLSTQEIVSLIRQSDGSISSLTLWDLLDNVEGRGGKVEIIVTFD